MQRRHDLPLSPLGRAVREYDFALDGVRSVSVDIHKLGYSTRASRVGFATPRRSAPSLHLQDWPRACTPPHPRGLALRRRRCLRVGRHAPPGAAAPKIVGEIFAPMMRSSRGSRPSRRWCAWAGPTRLVAFESADEAVDILAGTRMTERGWSGTQRVKPLRPSVHRRLAQPGGGGGVLRGPGEVVEMGAAARSYGPPPPTTCSACTRAIRKHSIGPHVGVTGSHSAR